MKAQNCHFTHDIIRMPTEQIGITVIGAGGTGSAILNTLARMNLTLISMDHPGLFVTAVDGDKVSKSNIGKQLYYVEDIGRFKAEVLIERININTGFSWEFQNRFYTSNTGFPANITIGCVDKIQPRIDIVSSLKERTKGTLSRHKHQIPLYYIDCGNSYNKGQVICQTLQEIKQPASKQWAGKSTLPGFIDFFGMKTLTKAKKTEDDIGSCSTYEALMRQDFFINPMMAFLACRIVWNLVFDKMILQHGYFVNLEDDFAISPLNI